VLQVGFYGGSPGSSLSRTHSNIVHRHTNQDTEFLATPKALCILLAHTAWPRGMGDVKHSRSRPNNTVSLRIRCNF